MATAIPTVNKALRFNGLAGDLHVTEQNINAPQKTQLLVRVRAASINPIDLQIWRSGLVAVVNQDKGLGRDFSGIVVALGSEVVGWKVGDEVFGLLFEALGQGTWSQYITVNAKSDAIGRKPPSLSHELAASVPLASLTAFSCLEWLPQATKNQRRRIIIRGASGGTGSWLIQIAKLVYDCHVTAICSGKNLKYVESLGADSAIDYTTESIDQVLMQSVSEVSLYDLLIDCVGGIDLIHIYPHILQNKGAYVTIVGDKTDVKSLSGPIAYFWSSAQILRYIRGYFWGPRYACVSFSTRAEHLEYVSRLCESKELRYEIQELIENAFDEEQKGWTRAFELMESKRVRGKIVLSVPGID